MGKHSKKTKDKNEKLQQTIRIQNTDEIKKIKTNKNKLNNKINVDNQIAAKKAQKNQKVKIKKTPSKFKKFFIKFTIILILVIAFVVGIWQGILMFKWQALAKQMCQNNNSIIVDLKRKYSCHSWLSKTTQKLGT